MGTVAEVITDAVVRRVTSPEPVNLAFGTRHSLLQLVALLEQQLGRALPLDFQPPRAGDVAHSQAQHDRLDRLFPGVRPVALADGVRATIEWMSGVTP